MFHRRQPRDPATRFFVIACVAVFAVQFLAGRHWGPVEAMFGLSGRGLEHGALWQLVTYQFLHANELHIFVNMLALWFAGRELEPVIGTPRFVALYLIGGIVGGLAQVLLGGGELLIGASASVCAVLLALTTLFPRLPVMALLFFVLPIRMKAGTLGWVLVGASVAFWLSGFQPGVGHIAHLGGFATGFVFGLIFRGRLGEGGGNFVVLPDPPSGGPARMLTADDVVAKVLRRGIDSLTREERRILEERQRTRPWR
ncbi:MAG: rhomboid family intramembrane serine protease [Chthoniobacterales bacterium]